MAFLKLLLLCSFMFCASMGVGCLPLLFSLSHRHLRTLTTFGVGLLIGTAFIVIIPEGIHTLYAAHGSHQHGPHSHAAPAPASPGSLPGDDYWHRWWQGEAAAPDEREHDHEHEHGGAHSAAGQQQRAPKPRTLQQDGALDAALADATSLVQILPATRAQSASEGAASADPQQRRAGGRSLQQHEQHADEKDAAGHDATLGGAVHAGEGEGEGEGEAECASEPAGSQYIGASLALGFVVMLLVDRLSGGHSHGPPPPRPGGSRHSAPSHRQPPAPNKRSAAGSRRAVGELQTASLDRADDDDDDEADDVVQRTSIIHVAPNTAQQEAAREKGLTAEERDRERERHRVEREKERERAHGYAPYAASGSLLLDSDDPSAAPSVGASSAATVGILVHSFVDGLALGAISVSSDSSLETVVFLAILLHKGPAALGLVSFLMYQGRSQLFIRTQLAIFSLCAPVAALLTYALLSSPLPWPQADGSLASAPTSASAVGLMLLFSGGTFLFTIAVHIMPTISQTHAGHAHSHGPAGGGGVGSGGLDHAALASPAGSRQQQQQQAADEERDSELGLLLAKQQPHSREERPAAGEAGDEPLEWRYVLILIAGILSPGLTSLGGHAHG